MIKRLTKLLLIKDNESREVGYFFLFFLLMGCGMALGRGTTDALFFKRYGIEYLPVMYIFLSILLCLVSTGYAAFADRLSAEHFFKILIMSTITLLIFSWVLMAFASLEFVYPMYFLIYEIASELLVIHAALYLNQNMETLQAKRLTPLIMGGAQIGIIIGGVFLATMSHTLGVQNILLIWVILLLSCMMLVMRWHKKRGASPYYRPGRKESSQLKQSVTQVTQGIKFMRSSELVRSASFALFFMVIVFYILCYSVHRIYTQTFTTEEQLTSFFGMLIAVTSSSALLMQLFLTNRVIHRFGIKSVNMFFPITTMFSYIGLLFAFTFPAALIGSFNKDALMPAFRNPVRNMFFNALPGYMQGRARAMSIVVVMPLALLAAGGVLWIVQRLDNPRYFLAVGLVCVGFYFYFNLKMNRAYVSEIIAGLKQKLFIPSEHIYNALRGTGESVVKEIARGVKHDDEQIAIAFSKTLVTAFPENSADVILPRLQQASHATRDQLLKLLVPINPPELREYLWENIDTVDGHLKATIMNTLFALKDEKARLLIENALDDPNARIRASGIFGVLQYSMDPLRPKASQTWQNLMISLTIEDNLAGLDLLEYQLELGNYTELLTLLYKSVILTLLEQSHHRIKLAALKALQKWPAGEFTDLEDSLIRLSRDHSPAIRQECVHCYTLLPKARCKDLATTALEDSHPDVRTAAITIIEKESGVDAEQLYKWIAIDNKGSPRAQLTLMHAIQKMGARKEMMEQIAHSKAEEARTIVHASSLLESAGISQIKQELKLMRFTLNERLEQIIDLALVAMQSIEDPVSIGIIRAGIKSKDVRHKANACEALRNLKDKVLAAMLSDLIEDISHSHKRKKGTPYPFSDLKGALTWCSERLDPWLQQCAQHTLEKLPG